MHIPKRLHYIFSALVVAGLLVFPGTAPAMQEMAESQLDRVVAGSFSRFAFEEDVVTGHSLASMELNIRAETYASAEAFYSHYDPEGAAYGDGSDWDQHWENVTIGESAENPFKVGHFILEAEFEDFDTADRSLVSLTMGFKNADGEISAEFYSLTREDNGGTFYRGEINGGALATYDFDSDEGHQFLFQMMRSAVVNGAERPVTRVDFGGAEQRP